MCQWNFGSFATSLPSRRPCTSGRAAERLHISTPTLSQQIKAVEREIGAPLLVRHSRGVRLMPAERSCFMRAKVAAIRATDHALRETRRAAGVADPVLRFGLLKRGADRLLPGQIEELCRPRAGLPG